jgi:hypothetical protein
MLEWPGINRESGQESGNAENREFRHEIIK